MSNNLHNVWEKVIIVAIFPLVYTQLIPPRIKKSIRRCRLTELSRQILAHRVTTLFAPAGSGKTSWVASLTEEPDWPPTAWLSLDNHDAEPSYLLYHLVHALKRILPDFGNQALRTLNSLEDAGRDWLIGVSTIIEELPREKEVVVVLDDFHLIRENPAACGVVNHLVRWLPAGIHLIIISRSTLPLKLHRELLSGDLLEISNDQLSFTADETRELLTLLNLSLTEEDTAVIHHLTEGWAVGLRLVGMFLSQKDGDLQKAIQALNRDDSGLYKYLANEILDQLPRQLQDFLLDAALLPYLEEHLCNAALRCPDSAPMLQQLHATGLLSRIDSETVTWRLHHLVNEYLEQKAISLRSPDYILTLRRRAAAQLEKSGDVDRALDQAVACVDWPLAITLLHRYGYGYFMLTARLDALSAWLGRLPEEMVQGDHRLLYLKGMSTLQIDPDEALSTLSAAANIAAHEGDIRCQVSSLLAMTGLYIFTNNMEKITQTADRIPVAAALLTDSWARGIVLVAALGRDAWGDNLQRGVWFSRLAGQFKLEPEAGMSYLFWSSVIQYRLGSLSAARKLIDKALALPYVHNNERWTGTAYVILAAIHMLTGEHGKLTEISYELLRIGQKYNIPHQTAYAHRHLARLHLREGRLVEARREFELSRTAFIETNNNFVAELTKLDLLLLRMKAGENAGDLLPETGEILACLAASPGGQGLDDYALSLAGVIAMEAGELELAQNRLAEAAANCSRKGARQVLAGTQLLLAQVALLQGDEKSCDNLLYKALGAAEAGEWENFWDWHAETVYTMCRRALLKGIHANWATRLLHRWFPQRIASEAAYLLTSANEKFRAYIGTLLQNNNATAGKPVIHISCLGGFRVFVNGSEVQLSEWKTQKAANLFKYLTANRYRHPKEKIIEQLWPESGSQSGDASLRMALSHVRKALGFSDSGQENVILKRGMVYLNPEIEVYTDYEFFKDTALNALKIAAAKNPTAANALEQAARLYPGRFLPENLYDDWTTHLRSDLHNLYQRVLLQLIDFYRQQGNLSAALQSCRRYLSYEPADEQVGRTTMEILWQLGEKQQALSLFQDITAALAKEYDITPAPDTLAIYEKIRCS